MGFLTPLYLLGALAVAAPIVFHLIRRRPQGQQDFSSLMFLQPTPPRLTRRSRLDNWLLLLLRVSALLLIALAFARPYFREAAFLQTDLSGRQMVLLLDSSGSMQRPDVWDAAVEEVQQIIDGLGDRDRVALYTIDERLRPIVPLSDSGRIEPRGSQDQVAAAISQVEPSWLGSQLARGLQEVADLMNAAAIAGEIDGDNENRIILISDLTEGGAYEALQGYPWPEAFGLEVRQILPDKAGNARASLLNGEPEQADIGDANNEANDGIRLRVENNSDSTQQSFSFVWQQGDQAVGNRVATVQVPPGQVRVVTVGEQPREADRLQLTGDAWEGDNTVFVARSQPIKERVLYVGTQNVAPENDPGYYLEQAPLGSPLVSREVLRVRPENLTTQLRDAGVAAVVCEFAELARTPLADLRQFVSQGGTLLLLISRSLDAGGPEVEKAQSMLRELLQVESVTVAEAEVEDFALISDVAYDSPVFSPFASPKFNDFSKIRFWRYAQVRFSDQGASPEPRQAAGPPAETDSEGVTLAPTTKMETVAELETGWPLLGYQRNGAGHVWLLTSGWQAESSTLALSSKFVPLITGMLDPDGSQRRRRAVYEVGESIDLSGSSNVNILDSEGEPLAESLWERDNSGVRVYAPGLYQLVSADVRRPIAVVVPVSESRLTPVDPNIFEQYGIRLGEVESDAERREAARQLQVNELEKKQRLWQWLLTGALLLLGVETLVAGKQSALSGSG